MAHPNTVVLVITMPPREVRDHRFEDDTDRIAVAANQPCLFLYTYVPKQATYRNKERYKRVTWLCDTRPKEVASRWILRKLPKVRRLGKVSRCFLILSPARHAVDESGNDGIRD